MKRPAFIEALEAAGKKATPGDWTVQISGRRGGYAVYIPEAQEHEAEHTGDGLDGYSVSKPNQIFIQQVVNPKCILELIRYVQVLEKALDIAAGTDAELCMGDAERELFPEAQP